MNFDIGDPSKAGHLVVIPYPGRGHVNPMMNICKLLPPKNLLITFIVTEEWLGFISSSMESLLLPENIKLRSIANVIPSELNRAANFSVFLEAVYTKMEEPVERLLDCLEPPPTAFLCDTYLSWALEIGCRRNIPVASLWTMSPSMFSILQYLHLHAGETPGSEIVDIIPGLLSMKTSEILSITSIGKSVLKRALEAISMADKAHCLVLTCFYEMEPRIIDNLKSTLQIPIYPIGPSIPHKSLEIPPSIPQDCNLDYLVWLHSQAENSVLYVSLGSFLSVSLDQMKEIAMGLQLSGVRYFWVARTEADWLHEVCGKSGLVVPWCDQLRILCHSAIGGFLTHCGLNSTLEGLYSGVPMLTFPIFWDQIPNSKLIIDDLKVGLGLKKKIKGDNIVKANDIAYMIRRLMDGVESQEMRMRALKLKDTCRKSLKEDGSSFINLNTFVNDAIFSQGRKT